MSDLGSGDDTDRNRADDPDREQRLADVIARLEIDAIMREVLTRMRNLRIVGEVEWMPSNFISGRTLFAFKVAYDDAFSQYSPGILAELETVRAFHETPGLELGDGGTIGASYLDDYWLDSVEMRDAYFSTGSLRSRLLLRIMPSATLAKRRLVKFLRGGSRTS